MRIDPLQHLSMDAWDSELVSLVLREEEDECYFKAPVPNSFRCRMLKSSFLSRFIYFNPRNEMIIIKRHYITLMIEILKGEVYLQVQNEKFYCISLVHYKKIHDKLIYLKKNMAKTYMLS